MNVFVLLGVYVVVTCALYGWGGDFSKSSFTAFMVVMMIWLLVAAFSIILLPLWQGRDTIKLVVRSILKKEPEVVYFTDAASSSSQGDAVQDGEIVAGKKNDIHITVSGM